MRMRSEAAPFVDNKEVCSWLFTKVFASMFIWVWELKWIFLKKEAWIKSWFIKFHFLTKLMLFLMFVLLACLQVLLVVCLPSFHMKTMGVLRPWMVLQLAFYRALLLVLELRVTQGLQGYPFGFYALKKTRTLVSQYLVHHLNHYCTLAL